MIIKTAQELGKALNDDQSTIEIEGDLVNKVLKIKATGNVAWAVAFGAIAVALTSIALAPTPEPISKGIAPIAGGAAIAVLGVSTTTAAISICIAAGGIGALRKLRSYKIVSNTGDKAILCRR